MHPLLMGGVGMFVPQRPGKSHRGLSVFALVRTVVASIAMIVGTATFGASNVIDVERDAVGNIVKLKRQTSSTLSITGFSPGSGPLGTAVTISGTGFSPIALNNLVKFNGTAASVDAAAVGSLAVTVPAGATTGPITVTVGGATATSGSNFTVVGPSIASFSPSGGPAGTSVAVTGTSFDSTVGATVVKLNGVTAAASTASATSLSLTVPSNAASGRITATTAAGTGASAQDFVVPPPGIALADIVQTVRLATDGSSKNVAVGTPGKHALVLFDGAADGYYTMQFGAIAITPSSASVAYKIVKPDNSVLVTGTIGASSRPTIHLPKLPMAGTYTVALSPGSATFNANARVSQDPTLVIDGAAASSNLNAFYQSARFVLEATAGQRIGVGVTGVASTPSGLANLGFRSYLPNGTAQSTTYLPYCNGPQSGNPQGNCEGEITATVAGTYLLIAETVSTNYSNFAVQLSGEATATLAADAPTDVTLTRAGQDGRYTFTATAGDSMAIDLSGIAPQPQSQNFVVAVLKPDGVALSSCTATPPGGAYCELGSLAASGTYTVTVDPAFAAYGSAKLTLKQGATLLTDAAASSFTAVSASEAGRFRFSATAGQNLTVGITGLTYVGSSSSPTYLAIYRPDRTQVGSSIACYATAAAGCKVSVANLPQSGLYSVALLPPPGIKISANATLSAELTGTLTAGAAQSVTAGRAGQNGRYTFSGTSGDSTALKLMAVATTPSAQTLNLFLYRPDGAYMGSTSVSGTATAGILNLPSLPSTGTYTVVLDPSVAATWQAQVMLDPGPLLAVDGATVTLATSVAGEPLRYRVTGTAGQRLEVGISGLAYAVSSANSTTFNLYRPDGTSIAGLGCVTSGAGACETAIASLPSTGTYSIVLVPPGQSSITAGTLAVSTPVTGWIAVGGGSQTVDITRPGQTARITFSGTSGQLLRLSWASAVVSGGSSVAVSVLKPDGTTLGSGSFINAATGYLDIASLPSAGTYTVVLDPTSAATISVPLTLATR